MLFRFTGSAQEPFRRNIVESDKARLAPGLCIPYTGEGKREWKGQSIAIGCQPSRHGGEGQGGAALSVGNSGGREWVESTLWHVNCIARHAAPDACPSAGPTVPCTTGKRKFLMNDSVLQKDAQNREIPECPAPVRQSPDDHRRGSRMAPAGFALALLLFASASLSLHYGFFQTMGRNSFVSLPANRETLTAEQFPHGSATCFPLPPPSSVAGYEDAFFAGEGSLVRQDADLSVPPAPGVQRRFAPGGNARDLRGLLSFSRGRVSIATVDGAQPVASLRHSPFVYLLAVPELFRADQPAPAGGAEEAALREGEEMDEEGKPKRWSRPENALPGRDILACGLSGGKGDLSRLLRRIGGSFAGGVFRSAAGRYTSFIRQYAEKYQLASALVLAIMHTESNFDPFAVSRNQAVGLMQIVPDTAGNEVYRYITGSHGSPSLDTLFSPEHNIRYGAVYLHLLERRYFGGVRNPASRQMCIIAAYNGGPGAVLRLFDSDPDAAVAVINSLAPEALYTTLTTEMPKRETRRYVELVLARMRGYAVE